MSLQRGIVELRSNRRRRGIRRILATLETLADSGKLTWIRAKARLALVRVQLSEAATLTLTGNRRAARHLAERDSLITVAEKQAVVMFRLNEPEFALEGLLLLGDAYMVLYEDMLSYPPPRTIPPEDHAAYRMLVAQKAQVLKLKAYNRYDEGIRVGLRTRWMGSIMETLATRRDAIGPRAQSSDEPSPETAAPQGAPESD